MGKKVLVNSLTDRLQASYSYLHDTGCSDNTITNNQSTFLPLVVSLLLVLALIKRELQPLRDLLLSTFFWQPGGAPTVTIGHLAEGTTLPESLSLLQVMDMICYDTVLLADVPLYVSYGEDLDITVFIHGDQDALLRVEIYDDTTLLTVLEALLFLDGGKVSITIQEIKKDCSLVIRSIYADTIKEIRKETKVIYPVFLGMVHSWKICKTLTYKHLYQLSLLDTACQLLSWEYTPDDMHLSLSGVIRDIENRQVVLLLPSCYALPLTILILKEDVPITDFILTDTELIVKGDKIPYKQYIKKHSFSLVYGKLLLDVQLN